MFEHDVNITGKHATYIKFLARKNAKEDPEESSTKNAKIFERYIDVYMNAVVWGLLYGKRAKRDISSEDRARIYADAFAAEHDNCVFLYRMAMLLDTSTGLSPQERVDRAFRDDTLPDPDRLTRNMELFHDYVRGGIEFMYTQFTNGCTTPEDYLTRTYEVLRAYEDDIKYRDEQECSISYDEEISKLLK